MKSTFKTIVAWALISLVWIPVLGSIIYFVFWRFLINFLIIQNWDVVLVMLGIFLTIFLIAWAHYYAFGEEE